MAKRLIFRLLLGLLACAAGFHVEAQTNPAPRALPYTQDFGATSFATVPAGLAAWNGVNGNTVDTLAEAAASVPTSDATLTAATALQTTAGCYGFATSGNGRFYVQTSGNTTNGVDQLALSLDTTGWTGITLAYDVEILSAQPRTVGVVCQYRVGTSGGWTTLTPVTGQNPYSQAAGTAGVQTSPHIALPAAAENVPVVQVRWATWRGAEAGASSGMAIDNIAVAGTAISGSLSAAILPGSVNEGAGANAATLTVTRSGSTAAALPVTLAIDDATEAAYDGPNPLTIPAGQATATFAIRAVDDVDNDGPQTVTLSVTAPGLTSSSTTLQVLDNEDADSPPAGYYNAATGLTGNPLKMALKTIASPANYHQYDYGDTYTPLRAMYQDPANTANVLLVYSGTSIGKNVSYFPGGPSPDVSWSREHVWPESFGLDPDNVNPGSSGGDAGPDFTDLFNLRPCLQTVNQQRSNRYYDETTGTGTVPPLAPQCSYDPDSWEPRDVEKGDLARSIFYMAMRYDGTEALTMDLEIADTPSTTTGRFARLSTLLRWNEQYPVSQAERDRNQLVFTTYQRNRNPFIDHPEYIAQIWGGVGESKSTAAVTEGGAGDSYTLVLASQPTADVTITPAASPAGQVTISPASVTFTTANWNQPRTITLTAVNDTVHEATLTATVHHTLASADARYAALVPLDVVVTVTDDDSLGATLVSYGGPWDALPAGLTGTGLETYATSLGGDTATGSAKFADAGDKLVAAFTAAPGLLTYQLKGNPSSGTATSGTFLVETSVDGVSYALLRTVTDQDNADTAYSDTLASSVRYVRFNYLTKNAGNLQLDKLVITGAAGTVPPFQTWAAGYSLSGANAAALFDFDGDGYVNLAEYGLGRTPAGADSASQQPAAQVVGGKLRLTAVVRTTDPALTVGAQRSADLTNAAGWTSAGVSQILPVDQTGVAAGFTRVTFEVDTPTAPAGYLRLVFTLN